jgi:gamma-glutamylcyclotransferase (GGCT)/AIG2-like uncharacterized protein YtfP
VILPLFVYGTLRDPDMLAAVLGRVLGAGEAVVATAPDYRAVYFPKRLYPGLIPARGEAAPGLLLHELSPSDLERLDVYEGREYARHNVRVKAQGTFIVSSVYLPTIAIAPNAPAWALKDWQRSHKPTALAAEIAAAGRARRKS